MKKEVSNRLIGLFVILGLTLMFAFVLAFGIGKYFQERKKFVLYFEGSLHGLDVGAPVEFRGVKVGEVEEIRVELNQTSNELTLPVIVSIQPSQIVETNEIDNRKNKDLLRNLIAKGLSAEIKNESLLTGSLFVELDLRSNVKFKLHNKIDHIPEIPTVVTHSEKISDMLKTAHNTLGSIEKFVNSEKLAKSIDDLSAMMKSGKVAMGAAEITIKDAGHTIVKVDKFVDPIAIRLMNSLAEFPDAVTAIRVFADYLSRHPEALLKGKGN